MDHFSFSFGLVPRIRLQTKMTFDFLSTSVSFGAPPTEVQNTFRFKNGDQYPGLPFEGRAEMEHDIDLQYLIGINYHINDDFAVNIEFRNLALENRLMLIDRKIANPNSGTVSLGITWNLRQSKSGL